MNAITVNAKDIALVLACTKGDKMSTFNSGRLIPLLFKSGNPINKPSEIWPLIVNIILIIRKYRCSNRTGEKINGIQTQA